MLNYGTEREDIVVSTEPGDRTHSRLTVGKVKLSDSGNYTCSAPNTKADNIYVYVTEGKAYKI